MMAIYATTGAVLYESEHDTLRKCLEAAVEAGTNLEDANLKGADLRCANLEDANLKGADLWCANLVGANLRGADLQGADLKDVNLRGADLRCANLWRANFDRSNLWRANLCSANFGTTNIPVIKYIDNAIESAIDAGGRLDMLSWHGPDNEWCGTTHCRAGWAVHLAGESGKALEDKVGPHIAGLLIYRESRPGEPLPNFFDTAVETLADIRRCAARQRAERNP